MLVGDAKETNRPVTPLGSERMRAPSRPPAFLEGRGTWQGNTAIEDSDLCPRSCTQIPEKKSEIL